MLTDANAIIERLDALFVENFRIEVPSLDADLFDLGILNSLQFVELLFQIEQHFCFRIKIEDIDLDNLRTLARIAHLVAANGRSSRTDGRAAVGEAAVASERRNLPWARFVSLPRTMSPQTRDAAAAVGARSLSAPPGATRSIIRAGHLAAPTGLEASVAQTDCRAHAAAEPGSGDSTQQP